jgi:hypothetical protein
MAETQGQEPQRHRFELRYRAERHLSSLVISIEFTLISVMAGVVLAPLAANALELLRNLRIEYWPYIIFGLLYILFMWSGVISHSFTFVGWPFELGHNLFYIIWALVLAMQQAEMKDPIGWFGINIVQYLVAGVIGIYDLRILQRRAEKVSGAAKLLFELALARQRRLVRLFWPAVSSAILSFGLLSLFSRFFIEQGAHWLLAVFQVLVATAGLVHNAHSLAAWQEPIVQKAMEELAEEE